jgi:hypothetical protein
VGRRLAGVAGFVLVTQLLAVAVASYADWPAARAGAQPRPDGLQWITEGSAISPSSAVWVALLLVLVLAWTATRVGPGPLAAAVPLAWLTAWVLGSGGVAEIRAPDAASPAPIAVVWVSGVVDVGLAVALGWAGLHEVVLVLRARRRASAAGAPVAEDEGDRPG